VRWVIDDLIGRLSGDEFIVITQAASLNAVAALGRRIIEAIERELIQPRTTALQP
jgi:GGDEF domain-containing protein